MDFFAFNGRAYVDQTACDAAHALMELGIDDMQAYTAANLFDFRVLLQFEGQQLYNAYENFIRNGVAVIGSYDDEAIEAVDLSVSKLYCEAGYWFNNWTHYKIFKQISEVVEPEQFFVYWFVLLKCDFVPADYMRLSLNICDLGDEERNTAVALFATTLSASYSICRPRMQDIMMVVMGYIDLLAHMRGDDEGIVPQFLPFTVSLPQEQEQMAKNIMDYLGNITENGITHNVKLDLSKDFLIDLGVVAFFAFSLYKADRVMITCGGVLMTARFTKFGSALQKVFTTINRESDVEPQANFKSASLYAAGSLFVMKCVDSLGYCSDFGEVVSSLTYNAASSFGNSVRMPIEGLLTLLTDIVSKIYKFATGGDECPYSFVTGPSIKVRNLLFNIAEIEAAKNANKLTIEEASVQINGALEQLVKLSPGLDSNSMLGTLAKSTVVKLKGYKLELDTLLAGNATERVVPSCFIFAGGAGIGKSMFVNIISDYVTMRIASPYMKDHYIKHPDSLKTAKYSMNQTDQYSSGYRNQPVVIIDEADPQVSVVGQPSTPQKLIGMINSVAYPLNMANLEAKGCTYFTSKLILCTTNSENWTNLGGVSCPDAFWRRTQFVYAEFDHAKFVKEYGEMTETEALIKNRALAMGHCIDYKDGRITFEEYMSKAYEFVTLRIKVLSKDDDNIRGGQVVSPMSLVGIIVDSVKKAEMDLKFRAGLASRMVTDFALETPKIIEAQGGALSKAVDIVVPQMVTNDNKVNWFGLATVRCIALMANAKRKTRQTFEHVISFKEDYVKEKRLEAAAKGVQQFWLSAVHEIDAPRPIKIDLLENPKFEDFCKKRRLIRPMTMADRLMSVELPSGDERYWHMAQTKALNLAYEHYKPSFKDVFPWRGIVLSVGLFSGAIAMYKLFASTRVEGELQGDYPLRQVKAKRRRVDPVSIIKPEKENSLIEKVIRNNFYKVTITSPNKRFVECNLYILMAQTKVALIPKHVLDIIFDHYEEDNEAIIKFSGCLQILKDEPSIKVQTAPLKNYVGRTEDGYEWKLGATQYGTEFEVPEGVRMNELMLINVPLVGKLLESSLIDSTLFEECAGSHRECVMYLFDDDVRPIQIEGFATPEEDYTRVFTQNTDGTKMYYGNEIWQSDLETKNGDCGAPIFIRSRGMFKLAGIHVAGAKSLSKAYAVSLDKETISSSLLTHTQATRGNDICGPLLERPVEEIIERQGLWTSSLKDANKVGQFGHTVYASAARPGAQLKTKLTKSPIFKHLSNTHRYAPARLTTMDDGTHPMINAQFNYGKVDIMPDLDHISCLADIYWNKIAHMQRYPCDTKVMSFEQAVYPGEEYDIIRPISRSTSCGYPFTILPKCGKKDFFGDADEYEFTSEQWLKLKTHLENIEEDIVQGKRPLFVCNSFLKDERRKIEKVIAGKTRLVSGAPLDYTILVRKYMGGFVNWFMRHKVSNDTGVGVNPYSEDWNDIAVKHGYHGLASHIEKLVIAGDFSEYDKMFHFIYIWVVKYLANQFYDDVGTDSFIIRNALLDEIMFSRHMVWGDIIEWVGSNTSGNPLTTLVNSIANIIMIMLITTYLHMDFGGIKKNNFNFREVAEYLHGVDPKIIKTVFGDDNIISKKLGVEGLDWFLPSNLEQGFSKYLGIKYTDETKSGAIHHLRSIDEVTFLKRGFKLNSVLPSKKNVYLAPLELETIIESVRWYRSHDEWMTNWVACVNTAFRELSLHSKQDYESHGRRIIKAVNSMKVKYIGLPYALPNRSHLQSEVASLPYEF